MVDKKLVDKLKNDAPKFKNFVSSASNKDIKYVLDKLGKLENNDLKEPLLELLKHKDDPVRALAVKNLAKMKDDSLIKHYVKLVQNDKSSKVRREGTDAIGRARNEGNIAVLFDLLNDSDPSVIMSAIRGLLAFKKEDKVKKKLMKLKTHPNEIIRDVIANEFKEKSTEKKEEHAQSMDLLKNLIVQADVRDVLKEIKSENIHLTFTSPPYYNARDYSIYSSYNEYLEFLREVFQEVHRITKEGRFFLLNTSPVIVKRFSRSYSSRRYPIPYDLHPIMTEIGWEFIDDIVWVKPEASVINRNGGFQQHRKPLGYKPNPRHEMVMVYRKKTNKLLDWNMEQYDEEAMEQSKVRGNDYETSNIWEIDPVSDKVHRAVFPPELCKRVVEFYSYKGDLVFDPFGGSGTLAKAALNLDRFFFVTEVSTEYVNRIRQNVVENEMLKENYKRPEIMTLGDFQKKIKS